MGSPFDRATAAVAGFSQPLGIRSITLSSRFTQDGNSVHIGMNRGACTQTIGAVAHRIACAPRRIRCIRRGPFKRDLEYRSAESARRGSAILGWGNPLLKSVALRLRQWVDFPGNTYMALTKAPICKQMASADRTVGCRSRHRGLFFALNWLFRPSVPSDLRSSNSINGFPHTKRRRAENSSLTTSAGATPTDRV